MTATPVAGGPVSTEGMKLPFGYHSFLWHMSHNIADAGLGVGVPVIIADPVAASEEVGIQIGASLDEIYFKELLSSFLFLDRAEDIHARIHFTALNAADTGIDWSLAIKGQAEDQVNTDGKVSPDGSVTFAAKTSVATGAQNTGWAALNLTASVLASDVWLKAIVTCTDIGTASATELWFQAIEFRYTINLEGPLGVSQRT